MAFARESCGRYIDRNVRRFNSGGLRVCAKWRLAGWLCFAACAAFAQGQDFQAALQQGFNLHRQGRFSDAIPLLEHARRLHPDDYFANLLLGIDLLRTGKAREALPRLQLAARIRPGEDLPLDYLGEAEAGLGRFAEAAEAYQQALQREPDSEQALEAWAGFALERFRQIGSNLRATTAGVNTIRRLQQAAARPSSALQCRGSVSSRERTLADQPSIHSSDERENAYQLSICYAVAAGQAAVRLQSTAEDQAALDRLRGDVELRLREDPKAAEAEYRKAIAVRPRDPALLARLAEAEAAEGNADGARQSALAALAIDPHQHEALQTMTELAMAGRDYDQALPWLRRLHSEAPGDPAVQVELATALAQTGQAAEALRLLAPALAAGYPDEKGALHALEALILRQLGRGEEAKKAAAEARRLSDAFQEHSGSADGPHGD